MEFITYEEGFTAEPLPEEIKEMMIGKSFHENKDVGLDELAYLKMDADDERSMADNNSSAFNYRVVADTDIVSMHAYGRAIDINPLINPYIVGEKVMPANGAEYANRKGKFPHKIDHDDLCYKLFKSKGWTWGGDWKTQKDYQHFYKT